MESPTNALIVLATGLVPMIIGMIWYNPKVFGKAWQKTVGLSEEDVRGANMAKMIGLGLLYSVLIAAFIGFTGPIVHQAGLFSLGQNADISVETKEAITRALELTKDLNRNFGHGAFHGFFISLFFVLPLVGTHALYELKSFKYVLINWGYWAVSMAIMGGIISQWATGA